MMFFSLLTDLSAASMPGLSLHSKSPNSVKSMVLVGRITNTAKGLVDGSGESFLLVRLNYDTQSVQKFLSRKERAIAAWQPIAWTCLEIGPVPQLSDFAVKR